MKQAVNHSLPARFYDARAWLKSLAVHYAQTHHLLPAGALLLPLASLTRAIENTITIYGNFPQPTYQFLKQTINPLFGPNEYYNTIYLKLKELATTENRPNFFILAESLLFMRRLFEKDKEFIADAFSKELDLLDGTPEAQLETLAHVLHSIAKVHINQVAKMIKAFE
jgi:hypothetical protein